MTVAASTTDTVARAAELRASEADKERELRELFAARVAVLLALFCLIIALLQVAGFRVGAASGVVRRGAAQVSILLNLVVVALSLVFLRSHRAAFASPQRPVRWVRLSTHSYVSLVMVCMLGHIHLAGSQNTVNVVLILFAALLVQRMLGVRMGWLYFAAWTAAYLVLTYVEHLGWLRYAPLLVGGESLGERFLDYRYMIGNGFIFIMISIVMLAAFQRFEEDRLGKQHELIEARLEIERHRNEVQRLQSLIPVCASCKKIRDDAGFWQSVEEYLHDQGALQVTHGICPDCRKRLYPHITLGDTPAPGRGGRSRGTGPVR